MFSSMGVSRFLFTWFHVMGSAAIYLIITHGSSGYGNTISAIEELCPTAEVIPGANIYCEDIPDAGDQLAELIDSWNMGNKMILYT